MITGNGSSGIYCNDMIGITATGGVIDIYNTGADTCYHATYYSCNGGITAEPCATGRSRGQCYG